MAKKSLFEKLGLVEGVAASEYDMPNTTNELRVCSGVGIITSMEISQRTNQFRSRSLRAIPSMFRRFTRPMV